MLKVDDVFFIWQIERIWEIIRIILGRNKLKNWLVREKMFIFT